MKLDFNSIPELLDGLLLYHLKNTVETLEDDIYCLESARFMEEHDKENLKDYKEQRKAMRKVIKYFSTPDEWKNYKSLRAKNG